MASDGGIYNYLADGELIPNVNSTSLLFQDPGCAGTAYGSFGSLVSSALGRFLGPTRLVYRSGTFGAFGTPRVWKFTSATVTVPEVVPTYYNLQDGTCVVATGADTPLPVAGHALVTLARTPAPPDGVGPLTVASAVPPVTGLRRALRHRRAAGSRTRLGRRCRRRFSASWVR